MKISTWLTAALAGTAVASPTTTHIEAKRADISKYCSSKTSLCYSQWISSALGISFRVAIPPVTAPPFDIAIQIVAPRNFGWAGISWGGSMLDSPLTIGWLNGNNVTLSSRYAQAYQQPAAWSGANYRLMPDNGVNSTHWTLSAICTGCSYWSHGSIDPTNTQNYLAVALNNQNGAVSRPSDPNSTFSIHTSLGRFLFDFTQAKQANFNTVTKPK